MTAGVTGVSPQLAVGSYFMQTRSGNNAASVPWACSILCWMTEAGSLCLRNSAMAVGWSRGTDQSCTIHRCWHDLHHSASFPLMVLAHTPRKQLSESGTSCWSTRLSQGCVVSIHLLTAKVKSRNLLRSKGFSRAAPDFMASQICQKNQRC